MGTLLSLEGYLSIGTTCIGMLIFSLAPVLPVLFPAAITRLLGFSIACLGVMTMTLITGNWQVALSVSVCCLLVMTLVHLLQTRQKSHKDEPKV